MRKLYLLLFLLPAVSLAQSPTVGGIAAAPDDWLLGQGQKWHYRTAPAQEPVALSVRAPNSGESAIIERAKLVSSIF